MTQAKEQTSSRKRCKVCKQSTSRRDGVCTYCIQIHGHEKRYEERQRALYRITR